MCPNPSSIHVVYLHEIKGHLRDYYFPLDSPLLHYAFAFSFLTNLKIRFLIRVQKPNNLTQIYLLLIS